MRFEAVQKIMLVAIFFGTAGSNAVAECQCAIQVPAYHFNPINPDDLEWMEDFPWKFESCVGTQVTVSLVYEDNPLLDTYFTDEVGTPRIFFNGQWGLFPEFDQWADTHCIVATS